MKISHWRSAWPAAALPAPCGAGWVQAADAPAALLRHVRIHDGRGVALAGRLADGNPLEDLKLVAAPDKRFVMITKGGVVYKNLLPR